MADPEINYTVSDLTNLYPKHVNRFELDAAGRNVIPWFCFLCSNLSNSLCIMPDHDLLKIENTAFTYRKQPDKYIIDICQDFKLRDPIENLAISKPWPYTSKPADSKSK